MKNRESCIHTLRGMDYNKKHLTFDDVIHLYHNRLLVTTLKRAKGLDFSWKLNRSFIVVYKDAELNYFMDLLCRSIKEYNKSCASITRHVNLVDQIEEAEKKASSGFLVYLKSAPYRIAKAKKKHRTHTKNLNKPLSKEASSIVKQDIPIHNMKTRRLIDLLNYSLSGETLVPTTLPSGATDFRSDLSDAIVANPNATRILLQGYSLKLDIKIYSRTNKQRFKIVKVLSNN